MICYLPATFALWPGHDNVIRARSVNAFLSLSHYLIVHLYCVSWFQFYDYKYFYNSRLSRQAATAASCARTSANITLSSFSTAETLLAKTGSSLKRQQHTFAYHSSVGCAASKSG